MVNDGLLMDRCTRAFYYISWEPWLELKIFIRDTNINVNVHSRNLTYVKFISRKRLPLPGSSSNSWFSNDWLPTIGQNLEWITAVWTKLSWNRWKLPSSGRSCIKTAETEYIYIYIPNIQMTNVGIDRWYIESYRNINYSIFDYIYYRCMHHYVRFKAFPTFPTI